jgi:hypothetical protein
MKRIALYILFSVIPLASLPASGNEGSDTNTGTGVPVIFDDTTGPVLLVTGPDQADENVDSLFSAANMLYEKGNYEPALEAYHAIILAGFESAELYYNMGNAAYRSNSIGHAILYYEKALKLDPTNEDALHNLDFVSRYRQDTFEGVPRLFLSAWIKGFVQLLPEKIWSLLALLFFMIILAGLLIYLFSRQMVIKKTGFLTGLVSLFLFAIVFASSLSRYRELIHPDTGIIISPSVTVRSSPSESGTELFVLHEGTKIEVNEKVSGWQNIKVIDGREGWIMTDDFATI